MTTMICSQCNREGMYWENLTSLYPYTVCPHCKRGCDPIPEEPEDEEPEDEESDDERVGDAAMERAKLEAEYEDAEEGRQERIREKKEGK